MELLLGGKEGYTELKTPESYSGDSPWILNTGREFYGHFKISDLGEDELLGLKEGRGDLTLTAIVKVTIIDKYDSSYELLPMTWKYKSERQNWVPQSGPPIMSQ